MGDLSRRALLATAAGGTLAGCVLGTGECPPGGAHLTCSITDNVSVGEPLPVTVTFDPGGLEAAEAGLVDASLVGYTVEHVTDGHLRERIDPIGSVPLGDILVAHARNDQYRIDANLAVDGVPDLVTVVATDFHNEVPETTRGQLSPVGTARALSCAQAMTLRCLRLDATWPTEGTVPASAFEEVFAHPQPGVDLELAWFLPQEFEDPPIIVDLPSTMHVGDSVEVTVEAKLPAGQWEDVTDEATLEGDLQYVLVDDGTVHAMDTGRTELLVTVGETTVSRSFRIRDAE